MGETNIRPAEPRDSRVLQEMMKEFNEAEGIVWNEARSAAGIDLLLKNPDLGFIFVAEKKQLLGYAVVTFGFDLEYGGRDAFVTEIFVKREARRSGVATSLLEQTEEKAKDNGVLALHLQVQPTNEAAYRLYEKMGYRKVPRDTLSKTLASTG